MEVAGTQLLGSGQAKACPTHGALDLGGACFKHGDVIVCVTTACLRARLGTAPIRSRERQRADAYLLMTFCFALSSSSCRTGFCSLAFPFSSRVPPLGLHTHYARKPAFFRENERTLHCYRPPWLGWAETVGPALDRKSTRLNSSHLGISY